MVSRTSIRIPIDQDKIARFCRQHHINRLAIFGSALRDDFNHASDVDVLVEFEPSWTPGLIRLSGMEIELSELLGYQTDLRTKEDLSPYFRDRVVSEAQAIYVS